MTLRRTFEPKIELVEVAPEEASQGRRGGDEEGEVVIREGEICISSNPPGMVEGPIYYQSYMILRGKGEEVPFSAETGKGVRVACRQEIRKDH